MTQRASHGDRLKAKGPWPVRASSRLNVVARYAPCSRRTIWVQRELATSSPSWREGSIGLSCLRGEPLAQLQLAELADARLRDLVHELEAVGEPPLRELRREELTQLGGARRRALFRHDRRERPLAPLLVGHG